MATRRHSPPSRHGLLTDPETSARLARIRQHGTAAERLVRSWLHAHGVRFRVKNRDLPGSPDIANRSRRWAIFVHGCFWHRHPGCPRATTPKRNRDFWEAKFEANVARDARNELRMAEMGYSVFSVWECEAEDRPVLRNRLRQVPARAGASREGVGPPCGRSTVRHPAH